MNVFKDLEMKFNFLHEKARKELFEEESIGSWEEECV